ncbi:unnamed protein product [Caretta caretta]
MDSPEVQTRVRAPTPPASRHPQQEGSRRALLLLLLGSLSLRKKTQLISLTAGSEETVISLEAHHATVSTSYCHGEEYKTKKHVILKLSTYNIIRISLKELL